MDFHVFLVRLGPKGRGGNRLLRIHDHGISLVPLLASNPVAAEYSFEHIAKVTASSDDPTELSMEILDTAKQSYGYESVRLHSDSRSALLTVLFNRIDEVNGIGTDFTLKKHSNQRGGLVDTVLRVRSASLTKMVNIGNRQERRLMKGAKRVNFRDIVKLETLIDDEHIVLVYLASRVMRLSLKDSLPFLLAVQRNMKSNLKLDVEIQKIPSSAMIENVASYLKKGKNSSIIYKFEVKKRQELTKQERQRVLCITKDFFIEKWGDHVIGIHSLKDILGLIVSEKDDREVTVEFRSWRPTQYFLDNRDDFLASIADLMGMGKGTEFCIRLEPYFPHVLPDKIPAFHQNECEAYFLNRFIGTFNSIRDPTSLHLALKEYACNIHVGDSLCSDFKVLQAVTDTLKDCVGGFGQDYILATTCCLVLQRLLASRPCFESVKSMPEVVAVLFQCMRSENSVLSYLAIVAVRSAIKFAADLSVVEIGYASKQEFANRIAILSSDHLQQLVKLLQLYALEKNSALNIVGLLDILTLALTSQPMEIETGRTWIKAYEASIVAAAGVLCAISRSSSFVVFYRNAVLLKALLTKSSQPVSRHLQKYCLGRCVILTHLKTALFSKQERVRLLSGHLVFLLMEGNRDARKVLDVLLPKGVMQLYATKIENSKLVIKDKTSGNFSPWMETLEVLRSQTLETPVLVWNDLKRLELRKFLQDEVDGFYEAYESDHKIFYNTADVQLVYSTASEREGSVIGGVHLELLVDLHPAADSANYPFWKLHQPLAIFQSVFQAMVLGFTPLFGHNNLPELDLRLAVHVLTWIYERHADEVAFCLETLNVVETAVGMLREVVESEHQVFIFKLVVFLLVTVEKGGRDNVLRFIRSGGATVVVPLIVLSLAKCCNDKHKFECDAWSAQDVLSRGAVETLRYVGADGEVRLVRIPSGRAHELLERASQDGSMEAKEAIKWQDEKVPEKIQLGLALDLLEALLRTSGSDSTIEHFPPSAASFNFSREEIFCHLVQSLLLAKSPIFNRILEVVTTLVHSNKTAMSHLYKLGAFEILLWKLLSGDIVEWDKTRIAKFLSQCHLLQDLSESPSRKSGEREHGTWRDSVLHLYLPEGLILKLMSEGPESFSAYLDSEQNGPEIVWNLEMRQRLLDHLTSELESYVKFRATDPLALYIHVPKAPLSYPELEDSVFSAPFYIQNLLDNERSPNYQVNDPNGFLNSLMQDLRRSTKMLADVVTETSAVRKELTRTHLLIHALAHLVDRFPELVLPGDIESVLVTLATPSLRTCLAEKDEAPLVSTEVLQHCVRVLRRYCSAVTRDDEIPQASINFALSVLSLGTRLNLDGSFPEPSRNASLDLAVTGAFFILEIASSSRVGRLCLREDNRWQEGFLLALCSAAGDALANPPRGPAPKSFASLSCLKNFAGDEDLYELVLKQGLYLPLLLLAIPPAETALKARDTKSALLYSAADVLGTLIRILKQTGGARPNPIQQQQRSLMTHLIPGPLLACLEHTEGPDKFMTMAETDLEQPMIIWTSKVREELHDRVMDRLQQHHILLATGSGDAGNELEWIQSFRYECLKDEISVGGVFVKGLASGQWKTFGLPAGHDFLDDVLDYLDTNQYVLGAESHSGLRISEYDKVTLDEYLTVLASLKETLKYAVKVGRAELIARCRLPLLTTIAIKGHSLWHIQIEIASIVKVLAEDDSGREAVLQSKLMASLAVKLWECAANPGDDGMEELLMVILQALRTLSEGLPATVLATNQFASSGVLLPLLAIFCDVKLPNLEDFNYTGGSGSMYLSEAGRIVAAQTLGQLLLAGSGVSRRSKLLQDLSQRKSLVSKSTNSSAHGSANGHYNNEEGVGEATDMYELINIIESSKKDSKGVRPIVIQTFLLLLPLDLLSTLARDPVEACRKFDGASQTPRLVWDEGKRVLVKETLSKEARKLQGALQQQDLSHLPTWSMEEGQAVFVQWILITILYGDTKAIYRDSEQVGYAREMYLGGFFVDQFLRDPGFDFGNILEARFLCEVRKAVIIGAYADVFNFDDRRRLLLTLLLLFKARPYLLTGQSNIDIFLPVYDFMSNPNERRALAQPAMCLIHAISYDSDIADCIVSEELVENLVSLLQLRVPKSAAGHAGTDPRICSLMLLLRLMRLSSATVDVALRLGTVPKMADFIIDTEGSDGVTQRAIECLAMMCADKRKGSEVNRLLDKLVPENAKNYGAWITPTSHIRDEVVDSETVKHFLKHKYPCDWWTQDSLEGINDEDSGLGPVSVVNASVSFPKATMVDFNDEADGVFKRSVAIGAEVDTKDVHIVGKRPGSVILDFEVYFRRLGSEFSKRGQPRRPDVDARVFKEKLEYDTTTFFGGRYFGRMGRPNVLAVTVRHLNHTGDAVDDAFDKDVFGRFEDTSNERDRISKHTLQDLDRDDDHQTIFEHQPTDLDADEVEVEVLKRNQKMSGLGLFADEPGFRASELRNSVESPSMSPTSVLTLSLDDTKESSSSGTPSTRFAQSSPSGSSSANSASKSPPSSIPGLTARPSFNFTSRMDSLPPTSPSVSIPQGASRMSLPRTTSMSFNRTAVPGLIRPPSPGRIPSMGQLPPSPSARSPSLTNRSQSLSSPTFQASLSPSSTKESPGAASPVTRPPTQSHAPVSIRSSPDRSVSPIAAAASVPSRSPPERPALPVAAASAPVSTQSAPERFTLPVAAAVPVPIRSPPERPALPIAAAGALLPTQSSPGRFALPEATVAPVLTQLSPERFALPVAASAPVPIRSSSERYVPPAASSTSVPRSVSMRESQPIPVDPALLSKFNRHITVKFEDGRTVSLGVALALVLEGANLTTTKRAVAIIQFYNAFEEEQEELGRMIEKFPKLVQKFALQPHLCYDLMCVWEENCLDLLLNDELVKYGKVISALDICSVENIDEAVEEAKKKFQAILKIRKENQAKELKEKPKPVKADGGDVLNVTSGKKVQEELRLLPKFKLQSGKKKKGAWS
ncbi:uncharacterized protein [Physcomitrium patens]|uniref:DnaJ homologue subfamily C GRV2/DNAJC13 N-terminal domain-containing protein n=1 Tax=Physcomitrium patens TaxID=3218 RepID=A0A2K1L0L4_PHYPA|nr:uncharacterized protein LOC112278703 [Physcomitrium patens]PNR59563.1 hypothetical protein PHYPA_002354 [Physcomitrium patens]|eukprot:XP_024368115.1 uncharacterized protein LOC112278703 [Physcomitrella patens]